MQEVHATETIHYSVLHNLVYAQLWMTLVLIDVDIIFHFWK